MPTDLFLLATLSSTFCVYSIAKLYHNYKKQKQAPLERVASSERTADIEKLLKISRLETLIEAAELEYSGQFDEIKRLKIAAKIDGYTAQIEKLKKTV